MNITFDPLDPILLVFEAGWIVLGLGLLFASGKIKSGWAKASVAGLGLSVLGFRLLAVIPSWWLYFADGPLDWGGQGCVEVDLQCIKQTGKDSVVVIQNAVILGVFLVGFVMFQKRNPKRLAPGEEKSDATGGYK